LDIGFLTTGLLTGLREGVEAALIVSIVLAYLARTGNKRHFGRIWAGTAAAVAISGLIGVALWISVREFGEPAEQVFEGITMLLAAAVVTWMLFWMRRTSANIRGELHAGIDRALTDGGAWTLSLLAFTAVIREGVETALFLLGQATAAAEADQTAAGTLLGALVGLLLAAGLGYGFYHGARVINLQRFFRWTGVALVFVAAGLLSHAVHEFVEIKVITVGTATAYDISGVLPHEGSTSVAGVIGQMLRALFGYSASPEWVTLAVWVAYVALVLTLYLRPLRRPQPNPISGSQPAVGS
jgi:high-affinity iron transporter